ncbi:hypothetical protein WN943_009601 [Citrus x changshan-huyou]
MTIKELEGQVEQLSQQFHDKFTTIDEKEKAITLQGNCSPVPTIEDPITQLQSTPTPPAPSLLGPVPSTLPNNVKRLSSAEQVESRSKEFCFNCDEQFKPGHRCKQPQLLLLDADIPLHNPPKPHDHHADWKISVIETGIPYPKSVASAEFRSPRGISIQVIKLREWSQLARFITLRAQSLFKAQNVQGAKALHQASVKFVMGFWKFHFPCSMMKRSVYTEIL